MVAGQNEQGKEEAFTREAINPVMALTGASLGTEDTSPRPKAVRFLPAFLLGIFRYSQKLISCSYALLLGRCYSGTFSAELGFLPMTEDPSELSSGFCGWVFCLSFWPRPTASSPINQGVTDRALWNMQ